MDAAVQQTVTHAIRTALTVRGMTQAQFAGAMSLTRSALGNRMRGLTPWTLADISRAGRILGVPPYQIIRGHKYVLQELAEAAAEAS